jgi:hypothetical protein
MVDWSPVFVAILSVGVGAVLGAALTYIVAVRLDKRANKQKVSGLRELVYSEIATTYVALAEVRDIIRNELEELKNLNVGDPQIRINTWMKFKERAETVLETISSDWYLRATADPFIFIQLSDNEQRALRQIDLGQRAVIKKKLEQFTKIDIGAVKRFDPTANFEELEHVLGTTIDELLRENIKTGLDKKLLLQDVHDANKWHVTLIFDREKVIEGLPENVTDEQIVKRAKELTRKSYLKNEGEKEVEATKEEKAVN